VKITDNSGLLLHLDYDHSGELTGIYSEQDGRNLGYQIKRDKNGRIRVFDSSWEQRKFEYAPGGDLSGMVVNKQGATAALQLVSGKLHKIKQFDGGEYSITYDKDSETDSLPKTITTPNRLLLEYEYDDSGRAKKVNLGNKYNVEVGYDNKGRLVRWAYTPVTGAMLP